MAFPTIRAVSQGALTTAGLSLTITLPTGHASGDLLIIGVSLDGNRTMTAPDGWNLLANRTDTTANRHTVWYKTRGSTESNPNITWLTTTELGTWYAFAITTGTWSGTPEVTTAYASSANPNAPSLSPSWGVNETLWLALHGWDYNRTSSTNPTNYTNRTYQAGSSTASAGHRTHSRTNQVATEDPSQITISATDTWYAYTVAIKPYVQELGGSSTPQGSVYIGGASKLMSRIQVNIGGVWKDATELSSNIGGVWKNSFGGGTPANATAWTYRGTTGTHNGTASYISANSSCQTSATVLTWLTSNFAPQGYHVGFYMRVSNFTNEPTLCGYYYYEAT
jgi:hypothetical protein